MFLYFNCLPFPSIFLLFFPVIYLHSSVSDKYIQTFAVSQSCTFLAVLAKCSDSSAFQITL